LLRGARIFRGGAIRGEQKNYRSWITIDQMLFLYLRHCYHL